MNALPKVLIPALSPREARLLAAALVLAGVALLAPPLAQAPHYHQFADARHWLGIPCALDVLSNVPFALFGLWGLAVLRRVPQQALAPVPRALAALFCAGLVLTAFASGWYHWAPDDAGVAVDRLGMTVAFAGLLGLGVAGQVSARAGVACAAGVLLLGPASVGLWLAGGNLLPWAVLQGAGVVLLLTFAVTGARPVALPVRWGGVVALYALAKLLELADHEVFAWTHGLVSGHSLKHVTAALAAWPLIGALRALGQNACEEQP